MIFALRTLAGDQVAASGTKVVNRCGALRLNEARRALKVLPRSEMGAGRASAESPPDLPLAYSDDVPWSRDDGQKVVELPLPPPEMRALVGPTDPSLFDNPTGAPVFAGFEGSQFRSVLDFGCGCARLARQLIQQEPGPNRYEGIDLHAGMVRWCATNLTPYAPGFRFSRHDVAYLGFNPGDGKPPHAPLPFGDGEFSLAIAVSVFTHLTQSQTEAYLRELHRVLEPGGILLSTWFLFDKREFPMMQDEQNSLFINEYDIRNAMIYDRAWVRAAASDAGLVICGAIAPAVRGFQWEL